MHRFTVFTLTALLLSQMLADPITAAIVKQFPDKLGN